MIYRQSLFTDKRQDLLNNLQKVLIFRLNREWVYEISLRKCYYLIEISFRKCNGGAYGIQKKDI